MAGAVRMRYWKFVLFDAVGDAVGYALAYHQALRERGNAGDLVHRRGDELIDSAEQIISRHDTDANLVANTLRLGELSNRCCARWRGSSRPTTGP